MNQLAQLAFAVLVIYYLHNIAAALGQIVSRLDAAADRSTKAHANVKSIAENVSGLLGYARRDHRTGDE